MPKSPETHVTGRRATAAISSLCIEAGYACEVIRNDYGEDLLVQTFMQEEADSFRLWIQSKGTLDIKRFYSKKYGYSIEVSPRHLIKWARSLDPVIVVLWDVTSGKGYFADPSESAFEQEEDVSTLKKVKIIFNEEDVFDSEGLESIIWQARIMHYESLIKLSIPSNSEMEIENEFKGEFEGEFRGRKMKVFLVVLDFLSIFGMVNRSSQGYTLSKNYVDYLVKAITLQESEFQRKLTRADLDEIIILGLFKFTGCKSEPTRTQRTLPTELIVNSNAHLLALLEGTGFMSYFEETE